MTYSPSEMQLGRGLRMTTSQEAVASGGYLAPLLVDREGNLIGPDGKIIASLLSIIPAASKTVTPKLEASVLEGTAPLAVHFSAIGTQSTAVLDPFRQVQYVFNFGDKDSGVYPTDGSSKNIEEGGPLAWHVFEKPGTYQVTLLANDGSTTASKQVTITVRDPNVVYAGTKTVCVDPAGSTGWGPAGAAYSKTIPDKSTWNGMRIMLKRGADFTSAGAISITTGVSDFQVVAGGEGPKPILASISIGADRPPEGTTVWPTNIALSDLHFMEGFRIGGYGSNQLALRCDVDESAGQCDFGWSTYYMYDDPYKFVPLEQWPMAKNFLIAECSYKGKLVGCDYNLFVTAMYQGGIVGCDFGKVRYHNVRIVQAFKSVFAHNTLDGESLDSSYHALKVHGGSLNPVGDTLKSSPSLWATDYLVVQHNRFGSARCPYAWITAIAPENSTSAEGISNVVNYKNRYYRSAEGQVDVVVGGKNITCIENSTQGDQFVTTVGHDEALPAEWKGPYFTSRA